MVEEAAHPAAKLATEMMMAAAEMPTAAEFIPGMAAITATIASAFMIIAFAAPAFMEVFEKH
jgi:hypothetical protein